MRSPFVSFILITLYASTVSAQSLRDTVEIRMLAKQIKDRRYWVTYPDSILLLATKGLEHAERIDDPYGTADMHKFLGIYDWTKGDYASSIEHYTKAKNIYDALGQSFASAQILSNLGMVYTRLSDNEKALLYYQQALNIMQRHPKPDEASLAGTTSSMGLLLRNQGDADAAKQMFHVSIQYYGKLNDSLNLAGTYANLGTAYSRKMEYDSAIYYNEVATKIFERKKNVRGLLVAFNNLGSIALAKKEYEKSIEYLDRASVLLTDGIFFESHIATLTGLGEAYLGLKNYESAERFFLEAYEIARKKSRAKLIEVYKGLAACNKGMNRPIAALDYLERFAALKDSIFNTDNATAISNLRISYEVERKNAAIALLEKDNEIAVLSRNMIIAVAGTGAIFFGFMVYSLQRKRRKDKHVMDQKLEFHQARQEVTEKELDSRKILGEELQQQLEFRNRALTTYTLNLIQKNGMLEEVRGVIQDVLKGKNEKDVELKKLIRLIDYSFSLDKEWDGFKTYFEQVHPDFFKKLKETYPQLSPTELKLCALIRLSLSIKESATILSISPDSVKVARHRVRKKLGLTTDDNLSEFIMAI